MFGKPRLVCADVLVQREFEIRLLEVLIARFAVVSVFVQSCYRVRENWVLLAEADFVGERQ
jgi:hypothetical protein